jgi:predicted alpha/beta-hydrolase family hydrolase
MEATRLTFEVTGGETTSALWLAPAEARACLVLAHGAGAGMAHKAMEATAQGLAVRGVATLRYNFLYMDQGGKRPDPPTRAHAAVRAGVAKAHELAPSLPLFAGGRSFGGRMTSQAQAEDPIAGVRGLAFLGFPLHPAGKPGTERAEHLQRVKVPMLFVSGERDALAELGLLKPVVAALGELATLHLVADADHSLKVPARSSRTSADAEAEALDAMANWMLARI